MWDVNRVECLIYQRVDIWKSQWGRVSDQEIDQEQKVNRQGERVDVGSGQSRTSG